MSFSASAPLVAEICTDFIKSAAEPVYRKIAAPALRILLVSAGGIALMIGVALGYCVAMPGSSFQNEPPRLSASETALYPEQESAALRAGLC